MNQAKKVLHIQLLPILSGVQNVSLMEIKGLAPHFHFHLACSSDGPLASELRKINISVSFFDTLKREISPLNDLATLYKFWQFIKTNKFEIVHTHSSKPGLIGRIAAKAAGVKSVIHTVHGFSFSSTNSRLKGLLYFVLEFFAARFTDYLLVMNRSDFNFALNKLRLSPSKVIYLPNGVPDELFLSNKVLKFDSINNNAFPGICNQDCLKIVFVGRLWPQKNPALLVYALGILRDNGIKFSADFLGDGELFHELVALSNEIGISAFVKFSGWTSNASREISKYDVFVLPSRYEGMPLSIIEAMASRTTVIASNISGNNDLIRHLENGMLFDSDSIHGLADCLMALANDRALMKILAEEAFNEAVGKYKASMHCSKLLNIYKSC